MEPPKRTKAPETKTSVQTPTLGSQSIQTSQSQTNPVRRRTATTSSAPTAPRTETETFLTQHGTPMTTLEAAATLASLQSEAREMRGIPFPSLSPASPVYPRMPRHGWARINRPMARPDAAPPLEVLVRIFKYFDEKKTTFYSGYCWNFI